MPLLTGQLVPVSPPPQLKWSRSAIANCHDFCVVNVDEISVSIYGLKLRWERKTQHLSQIWDDKSQVAALQGVTLHVTLVTTGQHKENARPRGGPEPIPEATSTQWETTRGGGQIDVLLNVQFVFI